MPVPDCSYVNASDDTRPDGDDYMYCLQAEMRAMKTRMNSVLALSENKSFRNKLINGNFDIWQRGTSAAMLTGGSALFVADRWKHFSDSTNYAGIVSSNPFTLGQTDVPDEPEFMLRVQTTTAGSGATYHTCRQNIEDVRTLAGKTVMLSFYAAIAGGVTLPSVELQQYFGTGGSPSAAVITNLATNVVLTGTFQKFTYTVTLPSVSGKTIGTNNDDSLIVDFRLPINRTFIFYLSHVQLEEGSVATPFEQRPLGLELDLCKRYYEKSFYWNVTPTQGSGATNAHTFPQCANASTSTAAPMVQFKVEKRAVPTVVLFNTISANAQIRNIGANVDWSSTVASPFTNGIGLSGTTNASGSLGQTCNVHWTADAEL